MPGLYVVQLQPVQVTVPSAACAGEGTRAASPSASAAQRDRKRPVQHASPTRYTLGGENRTPCVRTRATGVACDAAEAARAAAANVAQGGSRHRRRPGGEVPGRRAVFRHPARAGQASWWGARPPQGGEDGRARPGGRCRRSPRGHWHPWGPTVRVPAPGGATPPEVPANVTAPRWVPFCLVRADRSGAKGSGGPTPHPGPGLNAAPGRGTGPQAVAGSPSLPARPPVMKLAGT